MVITDDLYHLNHFENGISLSRLLKECSVSYIEKLRKYGLIYMDEYKMLYLTEKGQVALQIGVDRYLHLEEVESLAMKTNVKQIRRQNNYLIAFLIILISLLIFGFVTFFV